MGQKKNLITKIYRLSNKMFYKKSKILRKFSKILDKLNFFIHNSHVPGSIRIGENVQFGYGGIGIVIHSKAIIGDHCMLGQGITIGGRTGHGGPPVIGNHVYISPGARILGGITIGNNVVVGANAVVIKDVPDNCVVAGVPAKIISSDIKKFQEEGII